MCTILKTKLREIELEIKEDLSFDLEILIELPES